MADKHAIDTVGAELHAFLIQLGKKPDCVSHKTAHYVEHILHLLSADDEETLLHFYGIFGHRQETLKSLADERKISMEELAAQIAKHLRQLAITPEWQMVKNLIHPQ
ncbi:hypothetical protein HMPREF3034_00663 [Prevotella sp. DNF00663]|uniref:hypothetical protein n=1 Tax=unclassified Prevotella TaxID=2638335 RepID=UPI00079858C1|nr:MULTISPECIES: hypothetical protein [unclassified Prevotella]KXB84745.1 hypothetical protein HMPREF3034_00663 [Prevotella sp. DNF00663]